MISYYDKLVQNIEKKDILINEPMSKHTSFKVGGNADYFIFVRNISDLKYVLKVSKEYNIETFIIGNGTNILVKDKGFRGAIIKLLMDKITFDDNKIIAEAGASLILLSNKVSKSGFTGFEGLSGIPEKLQVHLRRLGRSGRNTHIPSRAYSHGKRPRYPGSVRGDHDSSHRQPPVPHSHQGQQNRKSSQRKTGNGIWKQESPGPICCNTWS